MSAAIKSPLRDIVSSPAPRVEVEITDVFIRDVFYSHPSMIKGRRFELLQEPTTSEEGFSFLARLLDDDVDGLPAGIMLYLYDVGFKVLEVL